MLILRIIAGLMIFKAAFCFQEYILKNTYTGTSPFASKCMKSVLQKSFPCGTLISVVSTREDIDDLMSYLSNDNCYSFIIRRYKNQNWLVSTKVYILLARNAEHFSKGMARLTTDIFWNPKAHNIIEIEQLEGEKDVELVFDVLLRYNTFSAILLKRLSEDYVTVYNDYPFNGTNCGLRYDYGNIGKCDYTNKTNYFSNQSLKLRNCNITVVANKDVPSFIYEEEGNSDNTPGLEQFLLETIAEKEGIQVHYNLVDRELSFGVVLPNNTATGLLNFLQRDEVDIAAGGIILIKNRIDMFDYIWGYNYAAINLYTPAMGEEIWKDVYKEFSLKTWMLIILAYCTVTVICIAIRRWKLRIPSNSTYLSLKLWGYLYTNTCKSLSKEKTMRRLMIFWIWFTFFICNFYNTALYSLLTGRDQMKRYITVDDIENLPFEPCLSESTRTYFLFSMNKTLPTGRDIPQCKYSDTALEYVASGKDAYAIEMEYIYALTEYKYLDEDGHPKMDDWSFSSNNVIVMYLTRGFTMTKEFQNYAWRLYESGILRQHLEKLNGKGSIKKQPRKRHFKKMLLSDLRIHFIILAGGSVISVLCFIIECINVFPK